MAGHIYHDSGIKKYKNTIIAILSVLMVVIIDRFTKNYFSGFLKLNQAVPILHNILYLTLVHNTGIAFGAFKGCGLAVLFVPMIFSVFLIYGMFNHGFHLGVKPAYILAYSLILGGAIGNLIDRITLGYVVDFIDFRLWVCNGADIAISIGTAIFFFSILLT